MIFASDLDRTLIYSEKFLSDFTGSVKAVEYGKYISWMTEKAAGLLKELFNVLTFVPCTTRTIEQYRRIQFFKDEYVPRFAVVSNGGNIIVDGVVDSDYRKNIEKNLHNSCLPESKLLKEFEKIASNEWANKLINADGLFYYCIVDRVKVPRDETDSFAAWAFEQNWEVSVQGRKLYLVPRVVNKWSAVERIKQLAGEHIVFAAGDSLLDLSMIKCADHAVYPAHGEIYETFGEILSNSGCLAVKATKVSGLAAAEEILEKVRRFQASIN